MADEAPYEANDVFQMMRHPALATVLILAVGVTVACSADETEPDPRPSATRNTITAAEVGERLTITAGVVRQLNSTSFVV